MTHITDHISNDLTQVFKLLPGRLLLVSTEKGFPVIAANTGFEHLNGEEDSLPGKSLREAMPFLEHQYSDLTDNIRQAVATRTEHKRLYSPSFGLGTTEPANLWEISLTPVLKSHKEVQYLILSVCDKSLEASSSAEIYKTLIEEATVSTAFYVGPDLIIKYANDLMIREYKKDRSVIGKRLIDGVPELEGQPFIDQLNEVYNKGVTYTGVEEEARLMVNDKEGNFYYNYTFKPVFDSSGNVYAIHHMATDVTSEVLAKRALAEREQQLKVLLETAPFPIAVYIGPEMEIAFANDAVMESYGKGRENIIGTRLRDLLPEVEQTGIFEILTRVYETGIEHTAKNQRFEIKVGDEFKTFYYNYSCTPLMDSSGKVYGIMNTAADVTELNLTQSKVIANEQKFRNLVMRAPVGICIVDAATYITEIANEMFVRIAGKENENFIGRTIWDTIPEARDIYEPIVSNVIQTGRTFIGQEQEVILIRNGVQEGIYLNFVYEPLKDQDGNVTQVLMLVIDISDQVVIRKKIEESEKKYRDLSGSLEEMVRDRTQEISEINETYSFAEQTAKLGSYRFAFASNRLTYSENLYRLLGCEPDEFIPSAETYMTFVHPDDREHVQQAAANAFAKHEITNFEYRLIKKSGKMIYIRSYANIIKGSDGELSMIGTLQDISEERKQREQLQESNAQLLNMNKELESFAYISSHDLQEPLRKIQTFASRVIDNELEGLSSNARTYFERMHDAANRMQVLIDDLLAYSRTNSEERIFEDVSISDIIEEVMEELAEEIENKDADIQVVDNCKIHIIHFQFRQLLVNLIGNSLKFAKPGERPQVTITCKRAKGEAFEHPKLNPQKIYQNFNIRDNGIGFEPEYSEKIFEVFQRLHGKDKFKGTGIGLAIVKKIIDNHGGYISASGQPGEGATFNIYLPVA